MKSAVLCLLLLLASGLNAGIPRDLADDAEKYLLPWNIRPEHYDITLFTHIEQFDKNDENSFVFMGIVEISILVLYGDLDEIVLHTYNNIEIVSAQVTGLDTPNVHNVTVGNYDSETDKQSFQVSPPLLNNDRYRIILYYIGRNTDQLRGFYRSSYLDSNNETRWLLTTHFESFGARQAFPSFDEPEYKATFKLTIQYNQTLADQGYSAFFNTEIESEQIRNGVHVTTFKTTPRPLSTYLVAFILAPFDVSPEPAYFNSSFNGETPIKPLRTIGQPKYFSPKRQDLLSQVAGPAALNTMTKLTGVGYGMDKVEQAGIPDFGPGAMENWGLVTYRETALFFDNETGTTQQKQSIMSTTTHELAHQWFGDLVTLHWWTDVWLNEGFATYFATHAANEFREPDLNTSDWDLIGQFVTGTLQRSALQTDSKPDSRPLTAPAYDPATINSYFDGISYDKGGSVLRMWMHTLGSDIFYGGLNRYLKQQEESIGTPEILLASFDGVIDSLPAEERPLLPDTVAALFEGWHLQAGYPVLQVKRQGGNLNISQSRFLSSAGDSSTRWNVPLTYSTNLEDNFNNTLPVKFLLANDEDTTLELRDSSADWIVLNNQATGYYRVNYDSDNWEKLIAIANNPNTSSQIHPYNLAQIIDDAANLAASTHTQYLPYSVLLRLLSSLRHERSLNVWIPGLRAMDYLLTHSVAHRETYSMLEEYFSWLVEPAFVELSMHVAESDSHSKKLLRSQVVQMACLLNLPACNDQAAQLYNSRSAHPDMRRVVFCHAVKTGGDEVWETVLAEALEEDSIVRSDLLSALTCTSDPTSLKRLFKLLTDVTKFDNNDVLNVLSVLHKNNPGKSWWKEVSDVTRLRQWNQNEEKCLKNLFSLAAAPLTSNDLESGKSLDHETLETISNNQDWLKIKQPEILRWLTAAC